MARMTKVTLPVSPPNQGDLVQICLNRQWLGILHTCLTRLEWSSSWQTGTNTELAEQRTFELYQILRNAQECGAGGGNMLQSPYGLIRTNPLNACQLQQFNGTTWQTVFDYGVCMTTPSQITVNTYSETAFTRYETLINNYNQTIESIAPELPYQADGKNDFRDLAICYMCGQLIKGLCRQELERRATGNNVITGVSLTSIGALVGTAFFTGGASLFAYGVTAIASMLAGAIGIVATDLTNQASTLLNDTNAQNAVACAMANRIKSTALTETIFSNSINLADHAEGTNAHQIASIIAPALANESAYIQFMASANDAITWAELGLIACECGGAWSQSFDFTLGALGWRAFNPGDTNRATYSTGNGWRRSTTVTNRLQFETEITMTTQLTKATIVMNTNHVLGSGGSAGLTPSPIIYTGGQNIPITWEAVPTPVNVVNARLFFSLANFSSPGTTAPFPSTLTIQNITLEGTGVNPFL